MLFQITQIIYWLALSTWFGGVLFIAIAAPIVFKTVRESNPVMTDVLSVNLEGQHGTLLAGSIVSNLLSRLAWIELTCAGFVLLALIPQFFSGDWLLAMIRLVLCLVAAGLAGFHQFFIWPRIQKHRGEYIDKADEPEVANPAKDRFDAEHRKSVSVLMLTLAVLLLLVMQSVPNRQVVPLESSAQRQ